MSIQNEPKAVQTWDSCVYTAEEEREFLKTALYPMLQARGHQEVEVFIWDHNKERLYERTLEVVDETTKEMISGVAFHWYSGDHFDTLQLVKETFPHLKLILSESCIEYSKAAQDKETENAGRLAHDMIGNLNHGMEAFYDWNMLLDETGGPNHVQNLCDAPFLFHRADERLMKRSIAEYFWHFANYILPGARRIASSKYTSDLDLTAWENRTGEIVIVALNRTEKDVPCVLRVQGMMTEFVVPAHAIVSGRIEA